MSHLLNIPLEVLREITSYLTTPEYGNLRRTCRYLEASLFGDFAKEFFSKRQFALIEFSIQVLVDIAKSRLGPSLTHLIIHLEHPRSVAMQNTLNSMFQVSDQRLVAHNKYLAESLNHSEFITTGLDVEMLSDAVKHLPNLETIGMRDFNSKSRSRDNTEWNSYGCPTFCKETGTRLEMPASWVPAFSTSDRGPEYTKHVFLTILRAIGNAAASDCNPQLTRIEILLHSCRLLDQTFKIPQRFDAGISSALSKLTAIFVDGLMDQHPRFLVGDSTAPLEGSGYFLSRFLVKAPALEHLRLNFQGYNELSTGRFLLWLAETPRTTDAKIPPIDSLATTEASKSLPANFPPTPHFPNLRYLDIGMASVTEPTLLTLYGKYKSTLRGVSLHKTTLVCLQDGKINLWARLCNNMAKAGLELTKIGLHYMKQLVGARPKLGEIIIKGSRNKRVADWKGSSFSHASNDITNKMEVFWPKHYHHEDMESDEDMDSDEDEDDSMDDDGDSD
ncbi:hypothetical protein HD806DRAFT_180302 [Xylariaceae sp. AK1471]|nr:hypothetical protein HD806DRAFT_180302 [Xylariaceae sp. AK1471]